MEKEMRLIDAYKLEDLLRSNSGRYHHKDDIIAAIAGQPTVDVVEVKHGRWERCGGDLHSSGYAIYCSVCHKAHFVHYKHSLGSLYGCKELFESPKYCPSCGAAMGGEQ